MEYRVLGKTGIRVSRLCFGTLTVGPLQVNLPVEEGAAVIRYALEAGVNFLDTAESYRTYAHIRKALQGWDGEVIIATKSYAYSHRGMRESLEEALRALSRDHIDIFLLHEQESALTLRGHWEAFEFLLQAREKGLVRAVGISTHSVEGVRAAARVPEIDVIHPLVNVAGVGIQGGTREDMLAAIEEAAAFGKGLYAMKVLGGGHLIARAEEAFSFALQIPYLASVAVGMRSREEVDFNVRFFTGREVPAELRQILEKRERRLHIEEWCCGCGRCVEKCGAGALSLSGGRAVVDHSRCRLCGYCGAACPHFCIKVL
ncbi:aldo/keto reductase [Desulfovirgula thermocuniculi]|uniref:aldo/keto reductase n=1 Tax=Desulfovirgula thermocuniculi TaxID=348842 RepID=UPI00040A8B2E|nr:aldo/keto reductase [Desulfovirgula thermocuniculi]